MERYYWQGNQAMTYGALDAGARFYAGYPITPSSEIAELSSIELPKVGGVFIQMEDELSSMAAICGAAASGKLAYTATSGPGFSLMQENLGVAISAQLPCVIIDVQRFGPSTGLATKPAQGDVMQSRWGTHGDHGIIVLSPESVQEAYTLMRRAFFLAQKYRTPVVFLSDEVIGHLRESAVVDRTPAEPIKPEPVTGKQYDMSGIYTNNIPPLHPFGCDHIVRFSGSMYNEDGLADGSTANGEKFAHYFTDKIMDHYDDIVTTEYWGDESADVVVIAYGCSARSAKEAVRRMQKEGIRAAVLRLITIWPFAEKEVREICSQAKAVIVSEMNLGQIYGEVLKYAGNCRTASVNILNAKMIPPQDIVNKAKEMLK